MPASPEQSLLAASARLLAAIDAGDWQTYADLCDERLTCFEPEAAGHLVEGLPFHKFYFDLPPSGSPRLSRHDQRLDASGVQSQRGQRMRWVRWSSC